MGTVWYQYACDAWMARDVWSDMERQRAIHCGMECLGWRSCDRAQRSGTGGSEGRECYGIIHCTRGDWGWHSWTGSGGENVHRHVPHVTVGSTRSSTTRVQRYGASGSRARRDRVRGVAKTAMKRGAALHGDRRFTDYMDYKDSQDRARRWAAFDTE